MCFEQGEERRWGGPWLGCVILWGIVCTSPAEAQEPLQVDTLTPMGSCVACAALVFEGTLGNPEIPLPFVQPMIDVASDGSFRLVDLRPGLQEGVAVLSASGELRARIGRVGDGPGELSDAMIGAFVDQGDSVIVLDFHRQLGQRIHLFDPSGEFVRSFRPEGTIARQRPVRRLSDGRFVMNYGERTEDGSIVPPLHVYSPEGERVCSFGTYGGEATVAPPEPGLEAADAQQERDRQGWARDRYVLAIDSRDRVWTSPASRYELQLWEPCGERPLRILHRAGGWLEPTDLDEYLRLPRLSRPPRPLALTIDEQGRLWVFVSGWSVDSDSGWFTRIDVLDPTDATIVATGELDARVFDTSGKILYSLEEHELGFVFLRIWSVHLQEP